VDRVPRVSVVVSHFDRADWLPEALASIRAQAFTDYEIVLVDDAGPVPELAARAAAAFGARYVRRESNGGVAATRNTGVRAAAGELIAYLDDDDLWRPRHLAALVGALDARPGCALAYGDAEVWRVARPAAGPAAARTAPGTWPIRARLPLAVPFDRGDLARDDFIVPGGMLHRRALYDRVGAFDEALFVSDDWYWLLRVLAREGDGAFVRAAETVVVVRIVEGAGGGNLSADAGARRLAALNEIERRHGTPPLLPKTFWEVAETYATRAGA
jgi:glycosyltransferase involved in cell wall biosynthesis